MFMHHKCQLGYYIQWRRSNTLYSKWWQLWYICIWGDDLSWWWYHMHIGVVSRRIAWFVMSRNCLCLVDVVNGELCDLVEYVYLWTWWIVYLMMFCYTCTLSDFKWWCLFWWNDEVWIICMWLSDLLVTIISLLVTLKMLNYICWD